MDRNTKIAEAAVMANSYASDAFFYLMMMHTYKTIHNAEQARDYLAKAVAALDAVINTNEGK